MTQAPLTIPGLQDSLVVSLSNPPQINFGTDIVPQLADIYDKASGYVSSYDYSGLVMDIKTVAIILSVLFGAILVWVVIKMGDLYRVKVKEAVEGLAPPAEAVTAYNNRWQEIKKHVNSFVEAEWKLAVIEGDKFVDDVLRTAGFNGESMGERLMLIKPDQLVNLQYLWDAHKLRNLLVHDVNFRLTHQQALFAINAFESVLNELGALT